MSTNAQGSSKRMGGQPDLMKLKTGVHDMRAWGEGTEHSWYAVLNEDGAYAVEGFGSRTMARESLASMKEGFKNRKTKGAKPGTGAAADVLVFEPKPDPSYRPLAISDVPMVNADETIARVMDQEMRPVPQPPPMRKCSQGFPWADEQGRDYGSRPSLVITPKTVTDTELRMPLPTGVRYSRIPKSVIQISAGGCRVRYQDPRTGKLGEWQEF